MSAAWIKLFQTTKPSCGHLKQVSPSWSNSISKNWNINIPLSTGSGPRLHKMIRILSQILHPFA